MSNKLNKLVTNIPVTLTEQEVINLSETLSAVRTAGGGGEGGHTYLGDGTYIGVDNNNNKISFLSDAANKLESVTDKLDKSDFETASANFATKIELESYYTKSQTSGADQLAAAFGDILDYNVTGAAGIEITTTTDDGVKTFGISMTAEPVVTDTTISGYNGVAAALDGDVSGRWNVGLTQDMLNVINGKEDILSFSYDGNTITAINTSAVGKEFDGVVTAGSLSGNGTTNSPLGLVTSAENALNKVNDKIDTTVVEQTYQTKSDMANYLTTSDAATTYQPKGDYATTSDISDMATQTWVGQQGFYTKTSGDNDYAPKSIAATVNTLTGASAGWNEVTAKLDKSIYANASGNWENTYNTVQQYSAAGTWLTAHQSLTNYYQKTETSGANELATEFAKYVTSSDITTQDTDYVMTTTGWKVLTLPGGGMTQVIHDTTLTGQGNANDNKLGVAWSALSGNTITSALSANSATTAANLGTSSFADITGAINAKADATAISDMLTKSEAAETYQTIAGMSNYLTTAQYNTDSATYVTSGNEISAANEQYALTTTGWTKIAIPTTFTGVTTTGSISGGGVNNDTIGLLTSAENALTAVANKVDKPDTTQTSLNNKYLVYSTLSGTGEVTGWTDFNANVYSKTESDGRYQKKTDMSSYLTTAQYETDSATFVTSSSDTITGTNQYALTTTGWASVETAYLPTSGGTVSGSTYFSAANGKNMVAVASAATLIGASRQSEANFGQNNNAMGTTWVGVGGQGMYRGFLKYTQGGTVGALDSDNTMQVEFTPSNKGQIFAKATNNGNSCPETQILNPVKTTCDNMSTSGIDANNMSGPNYMIAKNADGQFVIGAAVFNCQGSLPGTLQPNTYYFVY